MTPERWQRVEALYHAALGRPPDARASFLAAACPDDDALRRDVASLLDESLADEGFLDGRALSLAAGVDAALTPSTLEGQRLGGYALQALLGAGGMGEVYRALDTRLGREVAIKVLPQAFTRDPERLARLEREARMLAALNHPNICAIYGLEEVQDIRFLVLELIGGETLAERLAAVAHVGGPRRTGLPQSEALAIARQVADALDAAHDKGIIHRDLKPANINITPDGAVKVLDFGLAKIVSGEGSTPNVTLAPSRAGGGNSQGAILGTAAYMSPEQARGLQVDRRTDIWAFGCVLYEMLTGVATFAGETVADTIAKILEREPDWALLPASTPAPIRRLLVRCLAKDPKRRFRDISDVRIEIEAVDDALPGEPSAASTAARPRQRRGTGWLPWVALAALAVGVGAREAARRAPVAENPFASAQFSRLTDWEGTEWGAEISADGRFVSFIADHGGSFALWQGQVGTGRFTSLTPDVGQGGPGFLLRTSGFSGDGADIWFSELADPARGTRLIPLTGGTSRPFLTGESTSPSWSHDGSRLVYVNASIDRGDAITVADATGADAREVVASRLLVHNHNPVWSIDGEWIYFVRGLHPFDAMDVWRIRPSGGEPEQMTHHHPTVNFLAPLDTHTVLFVARGEDGAGPWLWALDVESRTTRRVAVGLEQYLSVASSRDGRRVVAAVANPTASLWRVPIGDGPAEERIAEPYPMPMLRALKPRFGGASLFYLSTNGVADGLWRLQDGEPSSVRRAADGALFEPPAVSHDGRRVAVVLRKDGRRHLAVMSSDGTNSRTLTSSLNVQGTADWSPDGGWIATGGRDETHDGLFKIPADGGAPVRLVAGQAFNPAWSPRGDLIVYAASVGGNVPLLGVRPDGTPVEMPPVRVRPGAYRFLPDGTGLVYLPHLRSVDFWLLDLATRKTRPLTRLAYQGTLGTFDITPDGTHIVFDRSRENSDILLIDLPGK